VTSDKADVALDAVQEAVAPTSPEPVAESAVAVDVARVGPDQPTATYVGTAVLCASAGLGLVVLTAWVGHLGASVPGVDESLHRWVVEHRTPATNTLARLVTHGGVTSLVLPVLLVVSTVAAKGGRDYWRRLQTGLVVTAVASVGVWAGLRLNALVGRARPPVADWAGAAGGPSFPSGHTTCATLVALGAGWVIAGRVRAGWPRVLVWVGAGAWALAVGTSRVWLGVHWPTDVVGGWLFGLTWFAGAATALALLRRRAAHRRVATADGARGPAADGRPGRTPA
jgi:membrane-associated phospholipid phosphatase